MERQQVITASAIASGKVVYSFPKPGNTDLAAAYSHSLLLVWQVRTVPFGLSLYYRLYHTQKQT